MGILDEQKMLELQKYQKMIFQLEGILKKSKDEKQMFRTKTELQKYRTLVEAMMPDGIPDNIEQSLEQLKSNQGDNKVGILQKFPIFKLSPHCNDSEVNRITSWINILDKEFLPILNEAHIKFDFSHNAEKDSVVKRVENIRRNIKVLIETIEEFSQSEKQEFKEQLSRMKNKQIRIFITEAYELFTKFKEFIDEVLKELEAGLGVIINIEDKIEFNPKFEKASLLEGYQIIDALKEFHKFLSEILDKITIPNLKF